MEPSSSERQRPRSLVIAPTYEERQTLSEFVRNLFAAAPDVELLIVDDASPDGTGLLADELARRDQRIHVLHRAGKSGLGTAYLEGFHWGLARDYELFFEMDADGSHDPAHLDSFFDALAAGAQVVLGSRAVAGGRVEGWGLGRHLLSRGGSLYARTILGSPVRDLTTGYKAFRRSVLERLDLSRIQSNGYSFQIELTYRAEQLGLKIVEVPIVFVDREVGMSKMDRSIIVEAVLRVWQLRLDAVRTRSSI